MFGTGRRLTLGGDGPAHEIAGWITQRRLELKTHLTKGGGLIRLPLLLIVGALLVVGSFLAGTSAAGVFAHTSGKGADTEKAAIGEIYQLQAAFHRAKTNQDIDLMMSLWAPDGVLHVQNNPQSPFVGTAALKTFWSKSPSFTHQRFSLVPSFKTTIKVDGAQAYLYFECHDVANYGDPLNRTIANDTFLAGTVRFEAGRWVFADMTAGPSSPLSPDHYYFP